MRSQYDIYMYCIFVKGHSRSVCPVNVQQLPEHWQRAKRQIIAATLETLSSEPPSSTFQFDLEWPWRFLFVTEWRRCGDALRVAPRSLRLCRFPPPVCLARAGKSGRGWPAFRSVCRTCSSSRLIHSITCTASKTDSLVHPSPACVVRAVVKCSALDLCEPFGCSFLLMHEIWQHWRYSQHRANTMMSKMLMN